MAEKRRIPGMGGGIHRESGDVDRALAYAAGLVPAALPAPERRNRENQLDRSRAVIDSSHVRAACRGPEAAPAQSSAHGRAAGTTSSPTARASRSRCP